jgi:GAF domain-containing protein
MTSSGPLADRLVALAGRADDDPSIAADLVDVAVLSTDGVAGVSYASVTGRYDGAFATVAASSELAAEVDRAQYAEDTGPCLEAFSRGHPAAVPDIAATMAWPGFRDTAFRLGLRASLSIPLFAGRGTPVAALNLYAHDRGALSALSAAVWAVYEADDPRPPRITGLDAGGADLIAGLVAAFAVRARIRRAVDLLAAATGDTPDDAYLALRGRAVRAGGTLADAAAGLLIDHDG